MNRRELSLLMTQAAGLATLTGLGLAPRLARAQPAAGREYAQLKTPLQLAKTGKVAPAGTAPETAHVETPKSTRDAAAILNGGDASAVASGDPFIYFVQVGAYSKAEDAEQQRARLALGGLRATVSERDQNGRTVHRVRLGPFDKKDEADAQTERAKAIDPDASLVRVDRSKQ